MTLLERAKELINSFTKKEYGSEADFSDLRKVDIAYTETEDGESVQVSCDLIYNSLTVFVNGTVKKNYRYKSLYGLVVCQLESLDFDCLTAI